MFVVDVVKILNHNSTDLSAILLCLICLCTVCCVLF